MPRMILIANRQIEVKEFYGRRVLSLYDVDLVHERPNGTANNYFATYRKHLVDGEDFLSISRRALSSKIMDTNNYTTHLEEKISGNPYREIVYVTESGYWLLAKSFTEDLDWAVQRQLLMHYFRFGDKNLSKEDCLEILNIISKTHVNALPLSKVVLNEIVPCEFDDTLSPTPNKGVTYEHEEGTISDSISLFLNKIGDIKGKLSSDVYSDYCNYCEDNKIHTVWYTDFTNQIKRALNITTVNQKINNKTRRVFNAG